MCYLGAVHDAMLLLTLPYPLMLYPAPPKVGAAFWFRMSELSILCVLS